jgi:hypothetical protein
MDEAARRRLRAYLLGRVDEEEQDAIEARYFSDRQELEAMEAEEEALIEDYLAGALAADERQRFARVYLEHPERRRRVEVIRGLMHAAHGRAAVVPPWRRRAVYATAAAAIVIAAALWVRGDDPQPPEVAVADPAVETVVPPIPVPSLPRIVAISLLPVAVRGPDSPDNIVQAGNADLIALELYGELPADLASPRVVIGAVGGGEAWAGPARVMPDGQVTMVRAEVPALRLPPEDYFVTLYAREEDGREREQARYVLRVRTP